MPFDAGPNGRGWFHRGFMCFVKVKDRRIRCIYKLRKCNLWIPREFYWENTSRADCAHYIDLLSAKKLIEAQAFEKQKLATDHTYERGDGTDPVIININAIRLVAMLRGEELLEIPIDSRIRFISKKARYTANDVDAEMLSDELTDAYFKALREKVGSGVPIVCAKLPESKELIDTWGMKLNDEVRHSGFNLAVARGTATRETSSEDELTPSPAPVSETEVLREDHGTHTETVSLITGSAQVPYFVRRLIRDQHLLWCGTSYDSHGPWSEYQRDQSRLAALGVVIA